MSQSIQPDHLENLIFVKEQADAQPLAKRARIYRWLASISGDVTTAEHFSELAVVFENSEARSREMQLALELKHQTGGSK